MNGLENAFFHIRYPKQKNKEAASIASKNAHSHSHTHAHREKEKHICEKETDNVNCVCAVRASERGGWVHVTYYTKCFSSSQKQLLIATIIVLSLRPSRFSIVFQQLKLFHPVKSQKKSKQASACTCTQPTHLFIRTLTLSSAPSSDIFAALCISNTFHIPSFWYRIVIENAIVHKICFEHMLIAVVVNISWI